MRRAGRRALTRLRTRLGLALASDGAGKGVLSFLLAKEEEPWQLPHTSFSLPPHFRPLTYFPLSGWPLSSCPFARHSKWPRGCGKAGGASS